MKVEELSRSYSAWILVRRWVATWVDSILFIAVLFFAVNKVEKKFEDMTILIWFGFVIFYYLILEGFTGFTIGKFVLRIRVVNVEGKSPGFVKALIRTLLRLFEVNPILVGGLPAGIIALASKSHQRLGDLIAKTFVVKTEDLKKGLNEERQNCQMDTGKQ